MRKLNLKQNERGKEMISISKKILSKIIIIFLVALFYMLSIYGAQIILKTFIRPLLDMLDKEKYALIYFLRSLDYGRMLGRIFMLVWSLTLYVLFNNIIEPILLTEHFVIIMRSYFKFFTQGAYMGFILALAEVLVSYITKSITISFKAISPSFLIFNSMLYLIAMGCTSIAEELIFRGYILERLRSVTGALMAIGITAYVFGFVHLLHTESLLYATSTLIAGLLLGYSFVKFNTLAYPIGLHWLWNLTETLFYSNAFVNISVNNSFLAGARHSPDQNGLLAALSMFGGLVWLIFNKRKSSESRL